MRKQILRHTFRRALIVPTIAAVTVMLAASPAGATPAQSADRKPSHCIANVTTPVAKVECFDSFPAAISKASGGRITDAPKDAGEAAYDAAFEAKLKAQANAAPASESGVRSQNIIEVDYDYTLWGTDTFTWWVENGGCETNPLGNVKYWVSNLDNFGWNDRINAFSNDHLCFSRHFEHADFQGLAFGWDYGRTNLDPLNGEISSIQWS